MQRLLEEYLSFGGYPRLVTEIQAEEKRQVMAEIYRSYLDRDVAYLLKVTKPDEFNDLIKILAGQVGQMVNYSELSNTLGIAQPTVRQYLWYLEKTFILERLTPFFRNTRKEIIKAPVVYFYDLGLRNYALGILGKVNWQAMGWLFQNLIWQLLDLQTKNTSAKLHYWRTKDKAEVDFVLDSGSDLIPIEVKYKNFTKPDLEKSLKHFITRYTPRNAYVITRDYKAEVKYNKTAVNFMPFWQVQNIRFK